MNCLQNLVLWRGYYGEIDYSQQFGGLSFHFQQVIFNYKLYNKFGSEDGGGGGMAPHLYAPRVADDGQH